MAESASSAHSTDQEQTAIFTGPPIGLLPSHLDFPQSVRTFYDKYWSHLPTMTTMSKYQQSIGPNGEYIAPFDRGEWASRFAALMSSNQAEGIWPKMPKYKADAPEGCTLQMVHIPGTNISLEVTHPPSSTTRSSDEDGAQQSADDAAGPVVLFFHGGGFTLRDAKSCRGILSRVATEFDIPGISVEYSRAPEHRFPTAHDEADVALRYILSPAFSKEIGYSVTGTVLSGTSSGANLAFSAGLSMADVLAKSGTDTLTINEEQETEEIVKDPVLGMVFTVPVCGVTPAGEHQPSAGDAVASPLMNADIMRWFDRNYARTEADLTDPRWCTKLQSDEVLSHCPPLAVFVATNDYLKADALDLVGRIESAGGSGGRVHVGEFVGLPHPGPGLDAISQEAREGNVEVLKAIGRMLGHDEERLGRITVESQYPTPLWMPEGGW